MDRKQLGQIQRRMNHTEAKLTRLFDSMTDAQLACLSFELEINSGDVVDCLNKYTMNWSKDRQRQAGQDAVHSYTEQ